MYTAFDIPAPLNVKQYLIKTFFIESPKYSILIETVIHILGHPISNLFKG